jgi:hypothetical protein
MIRIVLCLLLALIAPASAQVMLGGSGAPVNSSGSEGQFYFNTANGNVYGPKSFGVWPLPPTTPTYPAGGAAGSTLQLQYNNVGVLAGMSGTSWDDTNRSLTITGATITTSNPLLNLTQTWNGAGVTFEGLKFAITNTASAGASSAFNITVGGSSVFKVSPAGAVIIANTFQGPGVNVTSNSGSVTIGASNDVLLTRRAAANLRFGAADAASPVTQILSVQGSSGTDIAAAASFTIIGPLATGSAAPGDIILQTGAVGSTGTTASTPTTAITVKGTSQNVITAKQLVPGTVTVATLPTGVEGGLINVSDQLTACPIKGAAFTGGGTVTCLAHFEEGAWVSP